MFTQGHHRVVAPEEAYYKVQNLNLRRVMVGIPAIFPSVYNIAFEDGIFATYMIKMIIDN